MQGNCRWLRCLQALDAAPAERATEPVWILQVRECLAAACPGSGPLSSVWPTSFA